MTAAGVWIGRIAAAGAILALSGCAWLEGAFSEASPPPGEPAPPTVTRAPEIPVPNRKPAAPNGVRPGSLAALPPMVAPSTPVTVTPMIDATRLKQMAPEQVVQLFGDPDRRREEGPAIVWTYANRECELDLYFFSILSPNTKTVVPRVLDYVPRTGDGSERSVQRCLDQLAVERNRSAGSGSDRPR